MFEVEAKAHVSSRADVIQKLNSFARYLGSVHKQDTYYKNAQGIKPRIRTEEPWNDSGISLPNPAAFQTLLTYKRKEKRLDSEGRTLEVNDEKECTLSSPQALHTLFTDSGFSIYLQKEKYVAGWQSGRAHLELCTVPPLGDFLEIEILSETQDEQTVEQARKEIHSLFEKAGISIDQIENRYYSDMLKEAAKA